MQRLNVKANLLQTTNLYLIFNGIQDWMRGLREIAARASVRRKLDSRRGVLTCSGLENLENIVLSSTRKIFKDSLFLQ